MKDRYISFDIFNDEYNSPTINKNICDFETLPGESKIAIYYKYKDGKYYYVMLESEEHINKSLHKITEKMDLAKHLSEASDYALGDLFIEIASLYYKLTELDRLAVIYKNIKKEKLINDQELENYRNATYNIRNYCLDLYKEIFKRVKEDNVDLFGLSMDTYRNQLIYEVYKGNDLNTNDLVLLLGPLNKEELVHGTDDEIENLKKWSLRSLEDAAYITTNTNINKEIEIDPYLVIANFIMTGDLTFFTKENYARKIASRADLETVVKMMFEHTLKTHFIRKILFKENKSYCVDRHKAISYLHKRIELNNFDMEKIIKDVLDEPELIKAFYKCIDQEYFLENGYKGKLFQKELLKRKKDIEAKKTANALAILDTYFK